MYQNIKRYYDIYPLIKPTVKMRILYIISILIMMYQKPMAQSLKVMTYNIRLDVPKDGENNWDHRKESVVELLNFYHPDIFGIQEGLPHQVHYLDSALTDYSYFGVGREDGKDKGEFSALYYDTNRVKLIRQSTFWLSPTSDKVSVGWDAALPRICTYGLFEDTTTKKKFWVFNTHFDHIGVLARKNSASLIIKKVEEVNTDNLPVVVMGDLNSEPDSEPIKTFNDAFTDAASISKKAPYGPEGTFNGFDIEQLLTRRIDYIFVKGMEVQSLHQIDDRKKNNYYVSDHLPVMAEVELINQ